MSKLADLKIKLNNAYAISNEAYDEMDLAWGVLRPDDTRGDAYDDWRTAKDKWDDSYDLCGELQAEYDKELER